MVVNKPMGEGTTIHPLDVASATQTVNVQDAKDARCAIFGMVAKVSANPVNPVLDAVIPACRLSREGGRLFGQLLPFLSTAKIDRVRS